MDASTNGIYMRDWLGNELNEGDLVLYSSTSVLTGMNLGKITKLSDTRIQLQLLKILRRYNGSTYMPEKKITLISGTSAFRSVTRYFGIVLEEQSSE